ncbi:hypothetical protein FOZ62_028438 [Perkinsus olseni]|uniref:Uncharacterized protein n=1 Tax=Perkinsus olseni TaxID=32597 RepID=A0A7J6PRM5_PEROL|nr:hypothetical protein FOZ62_028438 [Perkinsus olseni]
MAGEAGKEEEEDGGWSQLEEDLQEKKATKLSKFERRQKRQQELFAAQGPDGLSGEAQEGDEEDDVLVTVNKGDDAPLEEKPATQAEARARDAVKKGRLRVRKDGSIYVRGTGGLGKNQHMTFDESGDEESEREEAGEEDEDEESAAAAKKAFVESMRQKVEEREEEDRKLMQEKVREKHRKIKEKLRRKRPEGEDDVEEVGPVLASPEEEDSDTAEDHDGEGSVEPPAKRQRGEMADLEAEALKLLGESEAVFGPAPAFTVFVFLVPSPAEFPRDCVDHLMPTNRDECTFHKNMFACGSAMALTVGILNPMDVIKVRMQTSTTTRTLWATVKNILHRDGVKGLFLPGLKSSMASDFVNGAFRVGLYPEVKGFLSSLCDVPPTSLPLSLGSSFLTGIVGSFLGNPFDLIKIRSQYEAGLLGPDGRYLTGRCIGSKPTYPSVWTGVYSLLKDGTLFRGAHATCLRAGLVTCAQVSGFEQTKRACAELGLEDGILTRLVSGIISGLLSTTVAAPVDLVRTRLMSSATSFPSLTSTVSNIIRAEGVRGLFVGWTAAYMRIGPLFFISWPLIGLLREQVLGLPPF